MPYEGQQLEPTVWDLFKIMTLQTKEMDLIIHCFNKVFKVSKEAGDIFQASRIKTDYLDMENFIHQ